MLNAAVGRAHDLLAWARIDLPVNSLPRDATGTLHRAFDRRPVQTPVHLGPLN